MAKSKPIDYSKRIKPARYERFAQKYHIGMNGRQSAIFAGFPKKSADSRASQLLRNIKVAGRIGYLQAKLSDESGVTALRLMAEWEKIGFANVKSYMGDMNKIKSIRQLTDDQAAAIASVTVTKTGLKVTFHSKETALEHMGKHIGFYEKDNRQVAENLADFLKAMKE